MKPVIAGFTAGLTVVVGIALYNGWQESHQAYWENKRTYAALEKEVCGTGLIEHLPKTTSFNCD